MALESGPPGSPLDAPGRMWRSETKEVGGAAGRQGRGREQDGRSLRWVSWLLMVLQEGLWTEEEEVGLGISAGASGWWRAWGPMLRTWTLSCRPWRALEGL